MMQEDRTSNFGAVFGAIAAILFVAVLFGGYSLLTETGRQQQGFTKTEPAPPAAPESLSVTPQSEQKAPVTKDNPKQDPETGAQNAN